MHLYSNGVGLGVNWYSSGREYTRPIAAIDMYINMYLILGFEGAHEYAPDCSTGVKGSSLGFHG